MESKNYLHPGWRPLSGKATKVGGVGSTKGRERSWVT